MSVIDEVAVERKRQIEVEGWTVGHDDEHSTGDLLKAAISYGATAAVAIELIGNGIGKRANVLAKYATVDMPRTWPWERGGRRCGSATVTFWTE